jgi:hypothetical protein
MDEEELDMNLSQDLMQSNSTAAQRAGLLILLGVSVVACVIAVIVSYAG